ncbi:unnamed protein product [Dibothriocephalus latus]|uniref:Uncharacterized protein n=1 Tax=Dibothriocephalus latus TaxID=60516 RepID=A0A3P6R9E9_DIBLA|nr:unnamed protein product [Dibothriocephalus latus]
MPTANRFSLHPPSSASQPAPVAVFSQVSVPSLWRCTLVALDYH